MFQLQDYRIVQALGEGGTGCTLKVVNSDDEFYALKIVRIDVNDDPVLYEYKVASSLPQIHPYTISMYGMVSVYFKDIPMTYFAGMQLHCKRMFNRLVIVDHTNKRLIEREQESKYVFQLMDVVEGPTLYDSILVDIRQQTIISNKYVVEFIFGLVYTLSKLNQETGFVHNDLTPHNIIMKQVARIQSISLDFGFKYKDGSTSIPVMIDFDRSTTNNLRVDDNIFGSFYVTPPEVLTHFIFNGTVPSRNMSFDVWSIAINAIFLLYPINVLASHDNQKSIRNDV